MDGERHAENRIKQKKRSLSVFDKPVIIRPKSTGDLRLLEQPKEPGVKAEQMILHMEQDLSSKAQTRGVQDEQDFEIWVDRMHDDLESATFEKYQFGSNFLYPSDV
jgi:hypothetical protein